MQRGEITELRERLANLKDPILNILAKFEEPGPEMLAIEEHINVIAD